MYVITAHQRYGQTDGRTSSDPMTATLLKHVAVKTVQTMTTIVLFGILSRTPWEPVADPIWSADPSLKTAALADYSCCSVLGRARRFHCSRTPLCSRPLGLRSRILVLGA